jgi:hypothetical protein
MMRVHVMRASRSPWFPLAMILVLLLVLPIIGGFILVAMASTVVGWIVWNLRGRNLGVSTNSPSEARVVVLDENHQVLRQD